MGCVVAVILVQGQLPLSSQPCFISSLLLFGEAAAGSPHTCAVQAAAEEREALRCKES